MAALRTVMPDCERAGVCLAIENHGRFKAATLAEILKCIDRYSDILSADKTSSLVRKLEEADWKPWAE